MVGTQSVTILFCDLVASTERRARVGDDAFDEFSRQLFFVLRRAVARAGGHEVGSAGDGMMVVFPHSVVDAVTCALEMHAAVAMLDRDDPPRLRIGISSGEVAQDGDQYSGMPIVEAARLEARAAPGQTLASSVVRSLVGTRRALRFRDVGALALKGIPEPLATVEVLNVEVLNDGNTGVTPAVVPRAARSGSPRRWLVAGAVAIVVALVVGGLVLHAQSAPTRASSAPTSTSATTPAAVTAASYPISYTTKPCPADQMQKVPGLVCGTLTVPEDRSKPHGRDVQLDVYRAPARGTASGDPTLDFGADNLATSPARDHGEEIRLANRGYGGTPGATPSLSCPAYGAAIVDGLSKPSLDPSVQRAEAAAIRACYQHWTASGVDPSQYNYITLGDDMVDLIRALHFTRINLVGVYAEAISMLEVIRTLPHAVRTLTVEDPVAPGQSWATDQTKLLADAFNHYVALCQSDPACHKAFPDLPGDLRRDIAVEQRTPRLLQAQTNNVTGPNYRHAILLDGPRGDDALWDALGYRLNYPYIAAAVGANGRVTAGGDTAVGTLLLDNNQSPFDSTYSWGADLSYLCTYHLHTINDATSALSNAALPEFAGIDSGALQWECKAWPVREISPVAFDEPSTTVPTLIVDSGLAPYVDPDWANTFRAGLPNATVLTFPTLDGNVLSGSDPPCLASLRRTFLADPTKALDTAPCEQQSPPIHFLTSLGG